MGYLVLARKYRPTRFEDVIGQEHITKILKNAIAANRVAHAYLFCGPRGIGKTSCARIFAKILNCQAAEAKRPCGECVSCREISASTGFDVLEIDGASNRGIDEIRTLRENVKFAPSYGRYKIYIIDEVHMLTAEAFNALLKTLEEPPEHVLFIFATTEAHKVPATIISRCQRYDFKRISLTACVETLAQITKKENLKVDEDALYAIAKAAQGSFRDALSILDQVGVLSDQEVKGQDVYSMLGLVELDLLFELTQALGRKDCAAGLKIFDEIIERGKDLKQVGRDLVEHYRNLMVIKVGGKTLGRLVDYPAAVKEQYLQHSQGMELKDILKAIDVLIEAQDVARITESLRIPLELAFAKLSYSEESLGAQRKVAVKLVELNRPSGAPVNLKMLQNQKGQLDLSPEEDEPEDFKEVQAEKIKAPVDLAEDKVSASPTIEKILEMWNALTYAVSQKKMFLVTYLQEGAPVKCVQGELTIGFDSEKKFQKESLETTEYRQLVGDVFSQKLNAKIVVRYVLTGSEEAKGKMAAEPVVRRALEAFQGKVVNQWHKE